MAQTEFTPLAEGQATAAGVRTREEALEYGKKIHEEAARILGKDAINTSAPVFDERGVVMTPGDQDEEARVRREHGGRTPDDKGLSAI